MRRFDKRVLAVGLALLAFGLLVGCTASADNGPWGNTKLQVGGEGTNPCERGCVPAK